MKLPLGLDGGSETGHYMYWPIEIVLFVLMTWSDCVVYLYLRGHWANCYSNSMSILKLRYTGCTFICYSH